VNAKTTNSLLMQNRMVVISIAQVLVALALSLWAGSTQAQQRHSNFQVCFPLISWFGPQHPAPAIDGQIDTDAGWDGAFKYVFGNGTTIPDVIVRGIRDNSYLYIAVQAYNLDSLTVPSAQSTLVVLAFDPGNGTDSQVGNPANMLRLHVFPIVTNPVVPSHSNPAFATYYWSGGLSTWGNSGTLNPLWLGGDVQVGYDADPNNPGKFRWSLEMKLKISGNLAMPDPTNGLTLPDSGPFGFYFDAFPVVKLGNNETLVPQYWPTNAPEPGCTIGNCTPDSQTPAASMWGNATRDPACGGASITLDPMATNIFTNQNPISKIALNAPNTFGAYIQNTSVDATSGTATSVPAKVTGTFTIANWGIPALPSWGLVPTTPPGPGVQPNPTNPATIDATACTGSSNNNNSACILNIGPWTLDATEQGQYANANQAHQCIRVQLAPAPGSSTTILNSVAQRNMDFGPASRFDRIAEISAKGYPPRAGAAQGADQIFDLHISVREEVLKPGQVVTAAGPGNTLRASEHEVGEGRVVSQLTWIANGCRHTGRYMTILEHRLEICEPVGAFGYVIRHPGKSAVKDWKVQLTGHGLKPVPGQPNTYQILIPQDGVATVSTHAEPRESTSAGGKVAVFLDAGAAVPHGTFGNAFNTGFSLNAGLEYIATSRVSAEGIFGYHHFPAKVGSAVDLYQFSANGKAYLTTGGSLRPFINAGVGGYKLSPGSTYFGGNLGAGVLKEFTPHWGVQASYNFHIVNTPGAAAKFSTIQGGIRYVF